MTARAPRANRLHTLLNSTLVLLILIVAFAAVIRFINLDTAPPSGDGDVAWYGLHALDWLDNGVWPYYIREMYAPEPVLIYLTALALPVTGISFLAPRLVTAVAGLLLVALLYPAVGALLGDEVPADFRRRAGLLASLAAATSLHAMYVSRMGFNGPLLPAAITLLTWLTARAWRKGGLWRWALAGVALGLTQYVYIPARVLPLALALWAGHGWLADREGRGRWHGWLILAGVAFILTLPNIVTFINTPEAFSARADIGSADTGGWVWNYDTSAYGGPLGLVLGKIGISLMGIGIQWHGAFIMMNQPVLGPVFFIGFLVALVALWRQRRNIAYAWPFLAIPVMLFPDLISGAVLEAHAIHQIGTLPFYFMAAGIGLAGGWAALERHITTPRGRRLLTGTLITLAILPALIGSTIYLVDVIPQQYRQPETSWRQGQAEVDIAHKITSEPGRAYLLPYEEYSRSALAWLVTAAFRDRHSAIDADGMLAIPNPPSKLTVVMPDDPYRLRHDGLPSQFDPRLWVLLMDGQTLLLPPLTSEGEQAVMGAVDSGDAAPLYDLSDTEIARFYTIDTPDGLFAARNVIDHPLDATFQDATTGTPIHLLGYTLADTNLTPGSVTFVTLYWRVEARVPEDYEIFAQITDDDGQVAGGAHDIAYQGMYRTNVWKPGEVVATNHWIQLPETMHPGRYTLRAGLFRMLQNTRLHATGGSIGPEDGVALAADLRVPIPPVTDRGTPPPEPVRFGDLFDVTGIDIMLDGAPLAMGERWDAMPGQTLTVRLTWETLARPPVDYSAFLHLSGDDSQPPLAQADVTMGGTYPTGAWRAGDVTSDTLTLRLPDDLAPGEYGLLAGVYYWQTNGRLAALLGGAEQPDDRLRLGTVVIGGGR